MKDFATRGPRHHTSAGVTVEVRRAPGALTNAVHAELVNLSREGFQLRLSTALDEQEIVVMRVTAPDEDLDLMFPAAVRWHREDDDGWVVGCKTSWQLDLETLGELFLSDILVVDPQ